MRLVCILGTIVSVVLAALSSACIASVPPPQQEPELYALYAWVGEYNTYSEDVHKLGVRWIRAGGWLRNRSQTDQGVLTAARHGVHFTPTLQVEGMDHGSTMPIEQAEQRMREVVRHSIGRYGPGGTLWAEHPEVKAQPIRYWQIWNEPNIEFLTPPEGMLRTEAYARLLKVATEELRRLDPGAKIVAFNTAGGVPHRGTGLPPDGMYQQLKYIGWRKFINDVVAAVGPARFDIVGTHPYTQPRSPERGGVAEGLTMLAETARARGFADKPVWFTEVGFPVEYPRNRQVRDEIQQACYTVRLYALAAAGGVQQVQLMYITDIIYGPDSSRRSFGVFTAPGQWRPQAEAMRVMIALLPDPRKDPETIEAAAGGVYAYRFAGAGGRRIVMAWTDGEQSEIRRLPVTGEQVTLVTMTGECAPAVVVDGRVSVTLTEAPVYLVPAPVETVRNLLAER